MPFDDKAFITNPGKWVNWPFLTVKKSKGSLGILIDNQPTDKSDPNNSPSLRTVYMVNMFALPETDLNTVEKKEYSSVDEMLADGWIVD